MLALESIAIIHCFVKQIFVTWELMCASTTYIRVHTRTGRERASAREKEKPVNIYSLLWALNNIFHSVAMIIHVNVTCAVRVHPVHFVHSDINNKFMMILVANESQCALLRVQTISNRKHRIKYNAIDFGSHEMSVPPRKNAIQSHPHIGV